MLVLTRKSNQSIMIGDDIEVSVLAIMGEKVRIGIQAPRDIPVFRKEVYLEIQQDRVAATTSKGRTRGGRRGAARARRRQLGSARRALESASLADGTKRTTRESPRLAEQGVERLEHRHGDDHRGGDQRQHEQPEAHRAALLSRSMGALARAGHSLAPKVLSAAAVKLRLVPELLLELREALAHLHRHRATSLPSEAG